MRYINLFLVCFLYYFLFFNESYSQSRIVKMPIMNMESVSWSPNSRELVFSRYPDEFPIGNRRNFYGIYKIDCDGTVLTTLYQRDGEGAKYSVFSPDGTKIAFVIKRDTNQDNFLDIVMDRGTIWTMDANGENLKQITIEPKDITALNWSTDGSTIIYYDIDIFTVKADGSQSPVKLESQEDLGGTPAQSWDGKYLSLYGYSLHLTDRKRFWIVDYATAKILNRFYDGDEPVYWSQDNSKVVCRRSIINVSDGSFVPLPVPGMLSPDGTKIFYEVDAGRAGWDNYVMFLDTPILLNQQK